MKVEIIKIKAGMSDPKGKMIPRGVNETLRVDITDELAIFYFKDPRTTKRFALLEIEMNRQLGKENNTIWNERTKKCLTRYPNKSKEAIKEIILTQLNIMGARCE